MLTNFNIESQTDTDDASSEEDVDDERNDSEEFGKDFVRYYEWARKIQLGCLTPQSRY